MMVCYDCWFPEAYRLLALQGADLICIPTNWVPIPGQDASQPAMANVLAMAGGPQQLALHRRRDRVGTERGQPFLGRSLIVSYTGWPVAGPASDTLPERSSRISTCRKRGASATGTTSTRSFATAARMRTT
jgi:predicted amidohydrolase